MTTIKMSKFSYTGNIETHVFDRGTELVRILCIGAGGGGGAGRCPPADPEIRHAGAHRPIFQPVFDGEIIRENDRDLGCVRCVVCPKWADYRGDGRGAVGGGAGYSVCDGQTRVGS